MSEHVSDELGGYVLGALEPDEAERVRRHLHGCAVCRREHERLAGLPALLELAGGMPQRAPLPVPPPGLEDAVVRAFGGRRRPGRERGRTRVTRPRAALGGALAGALATLVIVTLVGVRPDGSHDATVALHSTASSGAATATLHPVAWGTRIDFEVHGMARTRDGQVYELWFVGRGGRISAGTFTIGPSGSAHMILSSAARPGQYQRLGVTREPDGLDPARNGPTVLMGSMPR